MKKILTYCFAFTIVWLSLTNKPDPMRVKREEIIQRVNAIATMAALKAAERAIQRLDAEIEYQATGQRNARW